MGGSQIRRVGGGLRACFQDEGGGECGVGGGLCEGCEAYRVPLGGFWG